MATKRKRGQAWQYTVRRTGLLERPIYLSFADESEGDAYVARLEGLLDKGIVPEEFTRPDTAHSLRSLIADYLGAVAVPTSDRVILERLKSVLEDRPAFRIDYPWAESWLAELKAKRLAPGTIRHQVGAMARCLARAARRGEIDSNPLRLLPRGYSTYQDGARVDEERERRFEAGEEESIRTVLAGGHIPQGKQRALTLEHRESLVLLFELALESAMRLREMFTLEKRQVDLPKRTIFLEKTKNGDRRQVPLTSVAVAALTPWMADSDGLLMPFYDGHMNRTTGRLSRLWGRVFDHAGCPDLHFHDLRHEATCRIFERTDLSDLQIAKITGHRNLRMLARYANLRGSDLAAKLW
jgi:integrase